MAGQVNNFALAAFGFAGGAGSFGQNGSVYTLDFGTRAQGSGILNAQLFARNAALGPADLLDGIFVFLDPLDFGESGFDPFFNLAAGDSTNPLLLAFDTANLGSFIDSIVLHGIGHNASGFSAAVGDITLLVRGNVIAGTVSVPEPTTALLLLLALAMLWVARAGALRARVRR